MGGQARPEIGLSGAALLETGLAALERGDVPAAVGALGAIEGSAWWAIVDRFPTLPEYIRAAIGDVRTGEPR
jgi:hypothetical protein